VHQHTRSEPLCVTHTGPLHTRARACARTQTRRHASTRKHAHATRSTHTILQVLKTEKTDYDAEMARTGKLGGMDSAPPAFIGLSLFVVAYLVYLVVAA